MSRTALIIVDVQNDFLPGGALGVAHGNEVVAPLVKIANQVNLVVATRDWHPHNHCSFKGFEDAQGNKGIWPPHCIAGSLGAALHPEIEVVADWIISKATEEEKDAYSGFQGTHLASQLREEGIDTLYIGGIATDYCVLETVLDALKEGFEVHILQDACRAVNIQSDDEEKAIKKMINAGAFIQETKEISKTLIQ